jgi:hypothetical protein
MALEARAPAAAAPRVCDLKQPVLEQMNGQRPLGAKAPVSQG